MKYKLSDVMELIGGGTPKTTTPEYWNGNIPWLSVKDFNNDARFVYKTEKSITSLGLKNSSTTLLQKGDMIISARGTVGEIASIPFPMAFNQSCYGLRAKKNIVTEDYLYCQRDGHHAIKSALGCRLSQQGNQPSRPHDGRCSPF